MADVPLNDLLKIAVQLMARIAIRPEQIVEVVYVNASAKQLRAYNLCDGTKSQSEVAKKVGLDQGNFSRSVTRWVASGAVFRIGDGRDAKLLHLYPLTKDQLPARARKKRAAGKHITRHGRRTQKRVVKRVRR